MRAAIFLGQRPRLGLGPGVGDHDGIALALDLLPVRRPVGIVGAGAKRQGRDHGRCAGTSHAPNGGPARLRRPDTCYTGAMTEPSSPPGPLPDRLSTNPKSPYYDEALLARGVGIKFD